MSSDQSLRYRCVECGSPVVDLFKDFGNGALRLTDCAACGKVADPYMEVDMMYLFLEVFLQKEQVYRHILFNSQIYLAGKSRLAVLRLLIALVVFDAYAQWVLVESHALVTYAEVGSVFVSTLACSAVSMGAYLGLLTYPASRIYNQELRIVFHGVLLSMFGVLFNLLLFTWTTDLRFRYGIQALVYISNIVALKVISGRSSYYVPFLLVCFAAVVRYVCVAVVWALLFGQLPTVFDVMA